MPVAATPGAETDHKQPIVQKRSLDNPSNESNTSA